MGVFTACIFAYKFVHNFAAYRFDVLPSKRHLVRRTFILYMVDHPAKFRLGKLAECLCRYIHRLSSFRTCSERSLGAVNIEAGAMRSEGGS